MRSKSPVPLRERRENPLSLLITVGGIPRFSDSISGTAGASSQKNVCAVLLKVATGGLLVDVR